MKKVFIDSIKSNITVDSFFLVENPMLRTGNNSSYIICTLADKTGKLSCKIWGNRGAEDSELTGVCSILTAKQGSVFRILGKAAEYKGELALNVNEGIEYLTAPADISSMNKSDFVNSPADIEGNKARVIALCESINNDGLKNLVTTAIKKADGYYEKPAAKTKHHNYLGGLCEHSLEVADIAISAEKNLSGIKLNHDLVIAGALLHDIGKCAAFDKCGFSFAPNSTYALLGHITPAMTYLSHYAAFADPELYKELLHIIESHHGEHGDTIPQTPEAWLIHFADNISAKMHMISDDLKSLRSGESGWGKKNDAYIYRSVFFDSGDKNSKTEDEGSSHPKSQMKITDCF